MTIRAPKSGSANRCERRYENRFKRRKLDISFSVVIVQFEPTFQAAANDFGDIFLATATLFTSNAELNKSSTHDTRVHNVHVHTNTMFLVSYCDRNMGEYDDLA
ncbi:hypothetical protein DPMN_069033 [Dreissena polymorpha]|uniref:Uncharacterized protein n=1 Tax=Dreissena polymorpha TaxID=45954 RepID=A0A9D3Z0T2_DREPO|nr:hypothetical protein DPMN_069033 [Dreissena polymorpha]